MSENDYYLLLKWGTLKGWNVPENIVPLIKDYFKDGVSMSAIMDRPDDERKKILCEIIDKADCPITNDWDGNEYTKEQAKEYVMEYGK